MSGRRRGARERRRLLLRLLEERARAWWARLVAGCLPVPPPPPPPPSPTGTGASVKLHVQLTAARSDDAVLAACFSPDGEWCVTGSMTGEIAAWEVSSGRRDRVLREPTGLRVTKVEFLNGRQDTLFAASDAHNFAVLNFETGEVVREWSCEDTGACALALRAPCVAHISLPGVVSLWDTTTTERMGRTTTYRDERSSFTTFSAFALSPDAALLAVTSSPPAGPPLFLSNVFHITLWRVASGEKVAVFPNPHAHGGRISACCFSPDGAFLVTGAREGSVGVHDLTTMSRDARVLFRKEEMGLIMSLAFSNRNDGRGREVLAAGSDTGSVVLWDFDAGVSLAIVELCTLLPAVPQEVYLARGDDWYGVAWARRRVHTVAVSQDGTRVLAVDAEHGVRVFRACHDVETALLALLAKPSFHTFFVCVDGDHAIVSRVFGFVAWSPS